ncbi:MAG TPA: lipopolysaccharide biosynthesis protein [Azospirillaceae bacterium]|nr:lipopolysaccharide biosynthesis protein [Azospirillaceae bacterium]
MPAMQTVNSLVKATVTGTIWVYGTFLASKLLVFVTTLVLARLLSPEDFGLLALAMMAVTALDAFSDLGVGAALVQRRGDMDRATDVAFGINIAMGAALAAVAALAAPPVADFFGDPRTVPIMQALGLSFFINGLANIHIARMRKEMDFRRRFLPEIIKAAVKGGAGIALALAGFGVWSLVWAHLLGLAVGAAMYWTMTPWRPRLAFEPRLARDLTGYGLHIVSIGLIGMALKNVDFLMIGRLLDVTQLGFYTFAAMIPELVVANTCYMVSQAVFPAYSKVQEDPDALRSGFLATMRYVAMLTVPASLGLALIAADFMAVFYPSHWAPSVPVLQALAVSALVASLGFNTGDVFKAVGRPSILNLRNIAHLALAVPLFWWAAGRGIATLAQTQAGLTAVVSVMTFALAVRFIRVSVGEILRALEPALVAGAVMTLACLAAIQGLDDASAALRLPATVAVGATVYAAVLWGRYRALCAGVVAVFGRRTSTAGLNRL